MPKNKLKTPDWVLEGYDSPEDYNKAKGIKNKKKKEEKIFKIRKCPKCGSDNVGVVLGEEEGKGTGEWECKKCKWTGKNIDKKEISEEEFMKFGDSTESPSHENQRFSMYLDEKGEEMN